MKDISASVVGSSVLSELVDASGGIASDVAEGAEDAHAEKSMDIKSI
jgi:hypothetical protein